MATASQANAYGHQPGQGSAGNPGSVAATVNNLLGQGKHLVVVDGYLSEAPVWSPDQGSNGGRAGLAQCVGKSTLAQVAAPGPVQGGSASQLQPGEAAVQVRKPASITIPPGRELSPPEGSEGFQFVLGKVTVEGTLPALANATADLLPRSGQQATVADLYKWASDLQSAYFKAGYPLVRVIVPPQELGRDQGDVRLLIVSGFIDSIDTSGLAPKVRGRVERLLTPLVRRSDLTAKQLERQVLLAGETAGLELRSGLRAGAATGATILVLTGPYTATQFAVSVDNRVGESSGRAQVTASAAANSWLGLGENIAMTWAFSPQDPSWGDDTLRKFIRLQGTLPVGDFGLQLGSSATYSAGRPQGRSSALALRSEYSRLGVFASYPTIRTRLASQDVMLGLDATFDEQITGVLGFDVPLYTDRVRALRLTLNGQGANPYLGYNSYQLELGRGLDALGARSVSEADVFRPLSRAGADSQFTKLSGNFSWSAPIVAPVSILTTFAGQSSFNTGLLRSEQGGIISPDLVSGPSSGSLLGDEFIAGRVELQASRLYRLGQFAPYVFGAGGSVSLQNPTALERKRTHATAIGLGLRYTAPRFAKTALSLGLEWSLVDSPTQDLDRSWFTFSLLGRF
jgi:hemolysin activation/secretion protein